MSRNMKDFDYQLDLTPFISLLSVCICFLLLTVAWFQIGALSVKQVMGEGAQGAEKKEEKPSLWVYMKDQNKIEIRLKKGDKNLFQKFIPSSGKESDFDFQTFQKHIVKLKEKQSDLNEAFIFPQKNVFYEDIVNVMDVIRQSGIFSMGLSPI